MNMRQMEQAKKQVRVHYNLNRNVTEEEVWLEIANLKRKKRSGFMCDRAIRLWAILSVGQYSIDIDAIGEYNVQETS